MKYFIFSSSLIVFFLLVSCEHTTTVQDPFANGRWVDLSYAYDENTIYWLTADGFKLDTAFEGHTEGGYYYSAFNIRTAEHGGTHLDAPIHFAEGKQAADELSLAQLTGEAVVIDVSAKASMNVDYLIAIEDVTAWEEQHGQLPDDVIILFRTGHGRHWPNAEKYLGTTKKGDEGVAELHFPGIGPELAQWLVDNRKIKAVGIDTPSIDYGQSKDFMTHRILFEQNMAAFENVANLSEIPETGAYVVALPMKIRGGSGGPLRIVAFSPDGPASSDETTFENEVKRKFIENQ